MKKISIGICLVVIAVAFVSTRWSTRAVNAPPQDYLPAPNDTSLANALTIGDMVVQSDLIGIGSCTNIKSMWVDRSLVTLATVSLSETLKGSESGEITVVLPGGVDANRKIPVAMTYPGAPRLTPGEDVFLFLNANSDAPGGYIVAGFSQGKFSIVRDEEGEQLVSRDLTKTTLQGNNGLRRGTANRMLLSSLKAEVKQHLQQ
jgi:hypothetical protein